MVYCQNLGGYTLETWRRATSAESARIEAPRDVGFLGGDVALHPSQATRGSGGASWALPAGSGAKPRPPTHSGPQNPSSRNNALRNQPKIWGAWARFGGLCPSGPSLKPPLSTPRTGGATQDVRVTLGSGPWKQTFSRSNTDWTQYDGQLAQDRERWRQLWKRLCSSQRLARDDDDNDDDDESTGAGQWVSGEPLEAESLLAF